MTNTTFRLRLTKKQSWEDKLNKKMGLFEKLNDANRVTYNRENFSLDMLKKAIGDLYYKKEKNEYRKKFSFRSKIFKQTYKFGQ